MRSSARVDQAEGLRRLLVRNHTQAVAVLAGKPGVGSGSTTINLAAALAHSGKEVLVLDENHAPNNLLDRLGLHSRYDLLDVVREKCKTHEAVLNTCGFFVLPTARAMCLLAQLKQAEQQRLENALTEVCSGVDVLLVDAAMPALIEPIAIRLGDQKMTSKSLAISKVAGFDGQSGVWSGSASGVSLLVVVDATASGITDSYALIKKLALENACLQFEIVVNKAADEKEAMMVFGNMAKVALNNLAARLDYLGHIPHDDKLKRATQLGRPVIEAFPDAASAISYLELSKKLLHLPIQQNISEGGGRGIIQNLMRQVSQPLRQHSKKVAHVVNC
jgi:flagellar biosynthesis protein FlhG